MANTSPLAVHKVCHSHKLLTCNSLEKSSSIQWISKDSLYLVSNFTSTHCLFDLDSEISISSLLQIFLPKIIVMYSLAVIGGTFYLSKFPEKWFPGIPGNCSSFITLLTEACNPPIILMLLMITVYTQHIEPSAADEAGFCPNTYCKVDDYLGLPFFYLGRCSWHDSKFAHVYTYHP